MSGFENSGEKRLFPGIVLAVSLFGFFLTGCQNQIDGILKPKDFLKAPSIIDTSRQYGHLKTETVSVPATLDIFLAGADPDVVLEYKEGNAKDRAPNNSPVAVLEGVIVGGETLDIYAQGKCRHLPLASIGYGPKGWIESGIMVKTGPTLNLKPFDGLIGSLVGLFDNQRELFIIGQHKQIVAPRGARKLYLAMLDYPGASSDNAGSYSVTIDVIRR